LDNVSAIPGWFSDALCRAATGDGWVDRTLFTDCELTVLRYLRVLLLTSIDVGALRGDLGDRIVLVDLSRIPKDRRCPKRELDERFRAARPKLLGGLLDLLVRVLGELPRVSTAGLPRMADYACVLAALDSATGSEALARYAAQEQRVAEEVAEGDPVAAAVLALARDAGEWSGTAEQLLARIAPATPARGWPASARALSGRLRRAAEALRVLGAEVVPPAPQARPRVWSVRRAGGPGEPPDGGPDGGPTVAEPDRRAKNGPADLQEADRRRSDGSDGLACAMVPTRETGPGCGKEAVRAEARPAGADLAEGICPSALQEPFPTVGIVGSTENRPGDPGKAGSGPDDSPTIRRSGSPTVGPETGPEGPEKTDSEPIIGESGSSGSTAGSSEPAQDEEVETWRA
jgi:hypothetical protein